MLCVEGSGVFVSGIDPPMASTLQTLPHPTSPADSPHTITADEVLARLGVDAQLGLDETRVEALGAEFGPNQFAETPPESVWKRFLAQFYELVVWILIMAAIISGLRLARRFHDSG